MHRAILLLMKELKALDWYDQRVDVRKDHALRGILIHNKVLWLFSALPSGVEKGRIAAFGVGRQCCLALDLHY